MKEPKRIRATFITEAQATGRVVLRPDPAARGDGPPYFSGGGSVSHVCKLCGYPLTRDVAPERVRNVVCECPSCETLNAIGDCSDGD